MVSATGLPGQSYVLTVERELSAKLSRQKRKKSQDQIPRLEEPWRRENRTLSGQETEKVRNLPQGAQPCRAAGWSGGEGAQHRHPMGPGSGYSRMHLSAGRGARALP